MIYASTFFLLLSVLIAALIATIANERTQAIDLLIGSTLLISVTAYLFMWLFKKDLCNLLGCSNGWSKAVKGEIPHVKRVHIIRYNGAIEWNVRTTDVDWLLPESNPVIRYRAARSKRG